MLKKWDLLPEYMKNDKVKYYYDILSKKKVSLFLKRIFDIVMSLFLLILLSIPMIVICVLIKCDSKGTIFYRQERVTTCGKKFKIHKFRTMVSNADKIGSSVTVLGDSRITKVGEKLRNYRLDELPQLIDVLEGNMSFVGTRPEATKYVERYIPEYYATLLLPAGITSKASIQFKDEAELLNNVKNPDDVYINEILPQKMKYNLESLREFNIFQEIKTMIQTVVAVVK